VHTDEVQLSEIRLEGQRDGLLSLNRVRVASAQFNCGRIPSDFCEAGCLLCAGNRAQMRGTLGTYGWLELTTTLDDATETGRATRKIRNTYRHESQHASLENVQVCSTTCLRHGVRTCWILHLGA
jgi:hypothetical protein